MAFVSCGTAPKDTAEELLATETRELLYFAQESRVAAEVLPRLPAVLFHKNALLLVTSVQNTKVHRY